VGFEPGVDLIVASERITRGLVNLISIHIFLGRCTRRSTGRENTTVLMVDYSWSSDDGSKGGPKCDISRGGGVLLAS